MTALAGVSLDPSPSLGHIVGAIGHWQPKIGDPSFMGWFTVFSYYLCAGLSLTVALKFWPRMDALDRRFRISMAVIVLILGISKQFNLPAAITETGRIVASQVGAYGLRRWAQVFVLLLVATGFSLLLHWSSRHKVFLGVWERGAPEMIGLSYLCALVILRAVSLHQVGAVLSAEVLGVRINWIVELAGIYALVVILVRRLLAKHR